MLDEYGRTLAYVYLEDGTFLNAEVVKQGYGFAYRYFLFKYFDEFKQYEREARENEIGFWSDGGGEESQDSLKNENNIVLAINPKMDELWRVNLDTGKWRKIYQ